LISNLTVNVNMVFSLMRHTEQQVLINSFLPPRLKGAHIQSMKYFVLGIQLGLFLLAAAARGQTSAGLAEARIRGDVRCIQPMGDGSFVLGGYTAYFNGAPDGQLIRVFSNGARAAFPVTVSGPVLAMAVSGPWLYLGGDFQVVNGVSCPFAARVNAATGAVDPIWRPAPNGDLIDIVPVGGGVVLCGSFSRVAGLPRRRLALVSAGGSGQPVEGWQCDADAQVDRVLFHQGWLYAGGRFKTIGGYRISNLARINPATGQADGSWSPGPSSYVFDIAGDGTHLYCAGSFDSIGGANASGLARLPLNSAKADAAWTPFPNDLAVRVCLSGDSVYASGNFTTISGLSQKYLARIPKSGGLADASWKPPFDGALLALVSDGADGIWGGGRFDSGVGGGSGFARFTKNQGALPPVYPAKVENLGAVKVIKPNPYGGWLVGGDFDTVNGLSRHGLFRLLPDRTLDAGWSARLGGYYTQVNAMDVTDDGSGDVLIGGQFEVPGIGTTLLYNCLLLRLASGETVTTFKPQPSGAVQAIVRQGGFWLLGGEFTLMGPMQANYVARIGPGGNVDPSFTPQPDGPVHAILQSNGEIYLGGEFTGFSAGLSSLPLPYLARIVNGAPDLAWQPRPNQAVFALATEGNYLYAGGRFDRMARVKRKNLAQLPLGGAGTATAWNPAPDDEVRALRVDGGRLYAGGAFFTIANYRWPKLARFQLPSLALDTGFRTTGEDGAVYAIEPQTPGDLFIGGSFNGWDDDFTKRSLVRILSGASGAPLPPPAGDMASDEAAEALADYFAPSRSGSRGAVQPLASGEGFGLAWEENPGLPHGMVARVQWSSDMISWKESGQAEPDGTWLIAIGAEGARRTARLARAGLTPSNTHVFLRVVVTPGEHATSKLLQ
jgi:hypothetical protein